MTIFKWVRTRKKGGSKTYPTKKNFSYDSLNIDILFLKSGKMIPSLAKSLKWKAYFVKAVLT